MTTTRIPSTTNLVLDEPRRRRRRPAWVVIGAIAILVLAALMAIFGNLLAPDATRQDVLAGSLRPFSPGHVLGTDDLGRDVLEMTLAGAASALDQSTRPYVEATKMLNLSRWRIMFRHILPNVLPLIITNTMLNVAFALVAFSSLSFLGVGVPPGAADWGRQLADGRFLLFDNPATAIVPAVLIILVAVAANLVGDWLGERLERGRA